MWCFMGPALERVELFMHMGLNCKWDDQYQQREKKTLQNTFFIIILFHLYVPGSSITNAIQSFNKYLSLLTGSSSS